MQCKKACFFADIAERKVTSAKSELHKKREQCNAKKLAFLRTLPSAGNFDELAPTILKSFFQKKKRQFVVFYLAYS